MSKKIREKNFEVFDNEVLKILFSRNLSGILIIDLELLITCHNSLIV